MIGWVRKMLGIRVADTSQLRLQTKEQRQLAALARSERQSKIFQTLIAEVRK